MEQYRRYYGILIFIASAVVLIMLAYNLITPKITSLTSLNSNITKKENLLRKKQSELNIVKNKIKKIRDSITGSQKKIYSPIESDIGNDSLFFTLYNDVIEMVHSNSIKI